MERAARVRIVSMQSFELSWGSPLMTCFGDKRAERDETLRQAGAGNGTEEGGALLGVSRLWIDRPTEESN